MITGNKGEWSELYVLLKLISEKKIYAADSSLNKLSEQFFTIFNIYRHEEDAEINFDLQNEEKVEIYVNDSLTAEIFYDDFKMHADFLLNKLLSKIKDYNRTFNVSEIEDFMRTISCERLAARSSDKSDIFMKLHDYHTGFKPVCGFSIKSELGNPPTLINASKSTNFIFKVSNIDNEKIQKINNLDTKDKIKKRMELLFQKDVNVNFYKINNNSFNTSLMKIDSYLPQILSYALLYHYKDGLNTCKDIVEKLELNNPMNYPSAGFYEYKFKKFLCASALGLVPSKEWSGIDDASGGYIIVRKDGEVLAFYINNRNMFEDYLLKNTKFERGSTSRHDYSKIYEENGENYINLNLSIRFL